MTTPRKRGRPPKVAPIGSLAFTARFQPRTRQIADELCKAMGMSMTALIDAAVLHFDRTREETLRDGRQFVALAEGGPSILDRKEGP